MKNEAGKGDSYRKVDLKKYSQNYDKIFGKKNAKKTISNRQQTRVQNRP